METKCSSCDKRYNVSEKVLWKKGKCNWCWEIFIVTKVQVAWNIVADDSEKKQDTAQNSESAKKQDAPQNSESVKKQDTIQNSESVKKQDTIQNSENEKKQDAPQNSESVKKQDAPQNSENEKKQDATQNSEIEKKQDTIQNSPTEKVNMSSEGNSAEEKVVYQKEENIDIKPHFASYMFLWSKTLNLLLILFIVSTIIALSPKWWMVVMMFWAMSYIVPGFFLLLWILVFLWRLVAFKKEKYTLTDRKIVYHNWNLFSDNSVEISLDRIVQVKSTLWFIQYLIFKTGNIQIKTAWSSDSTVYFKNIWLTVEIYEKIKLRMKKNGFHLEMDKLVQEEKPHWLWIVWEVFWKWLLGLIFLMYIIFSWYQETMSDITSLWGELWGVSDWLVAGGIWFWTLVLLLVAIVFVLKYLDLKKRKYQIFTDTIVYKEWFLTKHHSFIPMENISDTENTQSFFSKIFGLHDVIVSSSWNNNKVNFKNMVNGEKMMENIKYLKNETILNEKDVLEWEDENPNSLIGFKNTTETALNYDKEFRASYKMSLAKSLFWLFVLGGILLFVSIIIWMISGEASLVSLWLGSFIPVALVLTWYTIIQIKFTDFIVWESSIEKKFGFLNTQHNSFSVEKITGVVFKESLIDKLFKTCSITFWSIWNGSDITFKNIVKVPDIEKKIKAKIWVQEAEVIKDIESQFTFLDYIKSAIWPFIVIVSVYIITMIFTAILTSKIWSQESGLLAKWLGWVTGVFWLILFLYILRFLYTKFYYAPVRYINRMYQDSIESIQWFFVVRKKYSLFRNVKWTKSTKYPLTSTWSLTFDIAWEQVQQNKKQSSNAVIFILSMILKRGSWWWWWWWWWWWTTTIISNRIYINFIKDVFGTFEETEKILNEEEVEKESILTSRQDIWNSIFVFVLIAIIMVVWLNSVFLPSDSTWTMTMISALIVVIFSIIIGIIVWVIKAKFYDYQKDRVLFNSGVIYKNKHSILYKKFNYVEFNKWFINKIFKNWNIKIYTLGSWKVDMSIKDIDNYKEVYELFKKD